MEPLNEILNNSEVIMDQLSPARTGSLQRARGAWRQVFLGALNALDQDTTEGTEGNYASKYPRRIQIQRPAGSITSTMIDDAYAKGIITAEKAHELKVQLGF